jgi:uroporphyrinogen-III decarboxylase
MAESMNSRERWLAALRCQEVDRLPFWPKAGGPYQQVHGEPYASMTGIELHRWFGSDPHVGVGVCVKETRAKTSIEHVRDNGHRTTIYHTPVGDLTAVDTFDAGSQSWHPREFPVKTADDIDVLTAFHEDVRYDVDAQAKEKAQEQARELSEIGVLSTGIGISPLMDWLQHLAGIEQGHFLLVDHPGKVGALFDVMHRGLVRKAEIAAAHSPADLIYSVENTSTTLISPDMFRQYCFPQLKQYGDIITGAGKLHVLHMCGLLKDVLPDIVQLPAAGIEAYTSPPVGNTTYADGRSAGERLCMIGGTNAWLWTRSKGEIIAQIERDIDELPHRRGIVVTSAGVMPPSCKPQTIRGVCQWVKSLPVD